MPSKKVSMKASLVNRTSVYGIMGGLYNRKISGRSSNNRTTSRLIIPRGAAAGLAYMQTHNLLSRNPLGSGGVGRMFRLQAGGCCLGNHLGSVKTATDSLGDSENPNTVDVEEGISCTKDDDCVAPNLPPSCHGKNGCACVGGWCQATPTVCVGGGASGSSGCDIDTPGDACVVEGGKCLIAPYSNTSTPDSGYCASIDPNTNDISCSSTTCSAQDGCSKPGSGGSVCVNSQNSQCSASPSPTTAPYCNDGTPSFGDPTQNEKGWFCCSGGNFDEAIPNCGGGNENMICISNCDGWPVNTTANTMCTGTPPGPPPPTKNALCNYETGEDCEFATQGGVVETCSLAILAACASDISGNSLTPGWDNGSDSGSTAYKHMSAGAWKYMVCGQDGSDKGKNGIGAYCASFPDHCGPDDHGVVLINCTNWNGKTGEPTAAAAAAVKNGGFACPSSSTKLVEIAENKGLLKPNWEAACPGGPCEPPTQFADCASAQQPRCTLCPALNNACLNETCAGSAVSCNAQDTCTTLQSGSYTVKSGDGCSGIASSVCPDSPLRCNSTSPPTCKVICDGFTNDYPQSSGNVCDRLRAKLRIHYDCTGTGVNCPR